MKKTFRLWGVLSTLWLVSIANIPNEQIAEEPLQWEEIPIVETQKIIPSREHKHITHYEPIAPDYEARSFTQEEAQMLMRIAQAEAGNQGIYGMMLIMEVVLNRAYDPSFPDSIKDVIFQEGQFQTVKNGVYFDVELSPEVHLALSEIEKGIPYDEEIIGFETVNNGKLLEQYFDLAFQEGGHNFYVAKK